nr:hypothetical protein [Tanacetum cinerariifolium]
MTVAGARETIGSQQAEKGVPLQAKQFDWLANIDEEIDEQELESHYSFIAKIQRTKKPNVLPISPRKPKSQANKSAATQPKKTVASDATIQKSRSYYRMLYEKTIQEVAESSSHNTGNSNVHTFNQPQVSEYRWTKDHPLEQVRKNPSKPVQTRRQLAIDPEMCMFALTVSTAELKNIKEAMADFAWINAMQEELH